MALHQMSISSILVLVLFTLSIRASDVGDQDIEYDAELNNCLEEAKFNSSLNLSITSSTELLREEIQDIKDKIIEAYRENTTLLIIKEDIETQSNEIKNALTNLAGSTDVQFVSLQISNMTEKLQVQIEQIKPEFFNLINRNDFEVLSDAILDMATNEKVDLISNKIDGLSTKQMIDNINDLVSNITSTLYMISDVTLKSLIENVHNDFENTSISMKNMHNETISHLFKVSTKDSINMINEQMSTLATTKSLQEVLDKLSSLPNNATVIELKEQLSNDVQLQDIRNEITEHFSNLDQRLSDTERVTTENINELKEMLSNLLSFKIDVEEINGQMCNCSEIPAHDITNVEFENIISQHLQKNQVFDGVSIIELVVISLFAVLIVLICVMIKLLCSIKGKVSHLDHQILHKSYYEQGSPLLSRMSTNGTIKRPHLDLCSITDVSLKVLKDSHL